MLAIRMGHLLKVDQGANGIVPEYGVNRAYTPHLISALQRAGEDVINVTPESAVDMADSLYQGINTANVANALLFVSCHVNAAASADANGCEVLYHPNSEAGKTLAIFVEREISALGFTSRGAKADTRGLCELSDTDMPAVIVEPFFCTSQEDVNLYNSVGAKGLGEAIAKGILQYLGKDFVPEVQNINASGSVTFTQVYNGNLEVFFDGNDGSKYAGTIKFDNIIRKG